MERLETLRQTTRPASKLPWSLPAGAGVPQVFVPMGQYKVADATAITWSSDVDLVGSGWKSIIYKSSSMSAALLSLSAVSDVAIRDLAMHADNSSNANGLIEILGASSQITVERCELHDAYSAIWIKQGTGIRILHNRIYDHSHPVYVGGNAVGMGGDVEGVVIDSNDISTDIAA